jgi:PAS domain S-box-containing protein
MKNPPRILLVDENESDRRLAELVLGGDFSNLEIESVGTATEFSAALADARFGAVITDAAFSWTSGVELIQVVREVRAECPVILFTAEVSEELWAESLRLSVDGYVRKSSEGFVRLASVLRSVLFRTRRRSMAVSLDRPYQRLVKRLPVGVFVTNLDGEIVEANPAFATMLGLFDPAEAVRSSFIGYFIDRHAADTWRDRMASSRYVGKFDTSLRRADGSAMWARISTWVVEDAAGLSHIQGVVEDTGDFHAARLKLAERTEALAKSNDELEQFAYIISHDLQQPLSVVSSYLEMLSDSVPGKLSDEESSYLDRATSATHRVQEMVDAVLQYSRVDSQESRRFEIDLEDVVRSVQETLWKEITCFRAQITSEELPKVVADPSQMEQLLQNLIGNALKFSGSGPAHVHISARELPTSWEISIRDEGIGLDPAAAERIFVMFQRLHTETEYPGTGIGLAICKRIVERHGGTIWVESEPGKGSTFFFTLAKNFSESGEQ